MKIMNILNNTNTNIFYKKYVNIFLLVFNIVMLFIHTFTFNYLLFIHLILLFMHIIVYKDINKSIKNIISHNK